MSDRFLGYRCQFAKDCPIYLGDQKLTTDIPLYLYRNIYCNRGGKGWKNCSQFKVFSAEKE